MSASSTGSPVDFSAMAKQYMDTLNDMQRKAAAAAGGVPDLQQMMGMWSNLASGGGGQADAALGRMNQQGSAWMSMMQRLAEQLSGKTSSPGDIAAAWKSMLSGSAADPFSQLFQMAAGAGATGFDGMNFGAPNFGSMGQMPNMQSVMSPLLDMPAFGFAREHQERWQAMARAHQDGQQAKQRYYALLAKAGERAYSIFEKLLGERSEPGRQISSVRGLFDLWIDAAETGYAEIALSPEFREVYGELVNAQMHSRALTQQQVEQATREVGMPTRSELDGSHRKVTELQREVRRLSRRLEAIEQVGVRTAPAASAPASKPVRKSASKATAKQATPTTAASRAKKKSPAKSSAKSSAKKSGSTASKKSASKKSASKKLVAKKPVAKKPAAKKPAAKNSPVKKASATKASVKKSASAKTASPTAGRTPRAPAKSAISKSAAGKSNVGKSPAGKSAAAKRRTRK